MFLGVEASHLSPIKTIITCPFLSKQAAEFQFEFLRTMRPPSITAPLLCQYCDSNLQLENIYYHHNITFIFI